MRRAIWIRLGRILYILTKPGISMVVRLSPPRTRIVDVSGGKLLLVKDWLGNGKWKLPGGGLHRDEDSILGALRELHEETGLTLLPSELQPLATFTTTNTRTPVKIISFYAELDTVPETHHTNFEISEASWLDYKTLNADTISNTTTLVLQHYKNLTSGKNTKIPVE